MLTVDASLNRLTDLGIFLSIGVITPILTVEESSLSGC